MRILLQRVSRAQVRIGGGVVGDIGPGLLLLVGFAAPDTPALFPRMIEKTTNLRIFEDDAGKMNLSVIDKGGDLLVVSQFTLYADCRRGRRPSFTDAAPPAEARALYDQFVAALRSGFPGRVETGEFGAMMDVELVNAGPVTILLDSADLSAG